MTRTNEIEDNCLPWADGQLLADLEQTMTFYSARTEKRVKPILCYENLPEKAGLC